MTVKELDEKIKHGLGGVYVFYGEEEYLKQRYLERARNAILTDETDAVFNHVKIENGEIERLGDELVGTALFGSAGGRLIELWGVDYNAMSDSKLDELSDAFDSVTEDTLIIYAKPDEFSEGTKKKPSAHFKKFSASANLINFEKQTPQKLIGWAGKHFASHGCAADPQICKKLIDYCTNDMFVLANEIEKVSAYARYNGKVVISEDMIYAVCSPSTVYGAFDFANAIIDSNTALALSIFGEMKLRKEKPEYVLSSVSRICSELLSARILTDAGKSPQEVADKMGMHIYPATLRINAASKKGLAALERAVTLCSETDVKIKTSRLEPYTAIEMLILSLGGRRNI
ncbi:MAG: DNA polymerase III subunit delta [Ruminococcaceae bacterium]|nr:DNA polymerase III subunit delta [Oscillospiraceae bacterium]